MSCPNPGCRASPAQAATASVSVEAGLSHWVAVSDGHMLVYVLVPQNGARLADEGAWVDLSVMESHPPPMRNWAI